VRRLGRFVVLVVAGLALSACTFVPTDGSPTPVAKHDVPFALLSPNLPRTKHVNTKYVVRQVWLINGNQLLAARSRRVAADNSTAESLSALFAGPTDHEISLGFSSQVPANYQVIGIGSFNGMIFVRLSAPAGSSTAPASALEAGQLVLTTAGVTNVYVEILVNDKALRMILPDGSVALQVRPTDYESLIGR